MQQIPTLIFLFFRSKRGLPYPINTARNVARTGSSTNHFLTADISFRTSPDLADKFISFVEESKEAEKLEAEKTREEMERFELYRVIQNYTRN
jgi:hypothetical protein